MKATRMLTIPRLRSGWRACQAICVLTLGLLVFQARVSQAEPMGTAFTYQGHLYDANHVADGLYDFQFKLFDDPNVGSQKGDDVNVADVDVIDGYFTVELDFGSSVFDGDARWLEISVRPGDSNDVYTTLSPRQQVTPTPYAIYAKTAGADNDWIISGNDMYSGVSGNVGIGPNSPSAKLDVSGDININSVYKIAGDQVLSAAGIGNIFVGGGAGENNTGNFGTFVGHNAGYNNEGNSNTFVGRLAGYFNTTGVENTSVGRSAGYRNTIGGGNTFIGKEAGHDNTEGFYNTFVGKEAGFSNTTGSDNTFVGWLAGHSNTTGYMNTFLGGWAGHANTEGGQNTFVGWEAGSRNTTGDKNTFLGGYAGGTNTTGAGNTYLGKWAGYPNRTGNYNTFVGYNSGAQNTAGNHNVFIGSNAGFWETGSNKLYIANGPNDSNVAIYGDFSTGSVGIGTTNPNCKFHINQADTSENIFRVQRAGSTKFLIDNDGKIGMGGNYSPAASTSLCIAGLGGLSADYRYIVQDTTNNRDIYYRSSSLKSKENVVPYEDEFSRILHAAPRLWIDKTSGRQGFGYIAEELVEQGLGNLVTFSDGEPVDVKYELVSLYLLEVVKDQVETTKRLKAENQSLAQRVEALETMIQQYQFAMPKEVQQ